MLGCCLDESSDGATGQVFAVGGFIAPHLLAWFEAERLWQKRLEQDSLPYFRAVDCQSVRGPFEKFRSNKTSLTVDERKKVDGIRHDLVDVLIKQHFLGFGFGLLMADYQQVRAQSAEAARLLGTVPYHLAYQMAMTHAALILHDTDDQQSNVLGFVCDEHETYAYHAKATYDELKSKNPIVSSNMGSLTYMDDKKSPAVQMADLMAYETMRKTLRWLRGETGDTPVFEQLKPVVYKIEMGNKAWLEDFVRVNEV